MSAKTWSGVSDVLSEVLTSTLKKNEVKTVMDAWNERKNDVSKLVNKNSGESSSKKKKDPNAPKKPSSGYIMFCNAQRENVKKSHPELTVPQIMSHLGGAWKALSDKEKSKYLALSEKDRTRYEQEMQNYTPPPQDETTTTKKKRGEKREGPKRPMSAYLYYCQHEREVLKGEGSTMKGTEVTTEIGRRWKALSDKEKAPYLEMQNRDKERYENEKSGNAPAPTQETKTPKTEKTVKSEKTSKSTPAPEAKKEKKTKEVKETATPAPEAKKKTKEVKETAPKTQTKFKKTPGFNYFAEENRDEVEEENPDWNSKKVDAELEKRWSALDIEDRNAYEAEANDDEVELDE